MKIHSSLTLVAIAVAALGIGSMAQAESTYGYDTAGGSSVTATARLNISIVVPKVVVLRVGSSGSTPDTLNYAAQITIQPTPTTVIGSSTSSTGTSQPIDWDSTAPTVSVPTPAQSAVAYAWTNGSAVTVVCNANPFAAGGPTLADVGVTGSGGVGNNFNHPATDLSGCNGAAAFGLSANTRYLNTWTYTLGGTPSSWAAGSYSTQVTYTAAGT